jgi:hypothetical protein
MKKLLTLIGFIILSQAKAQTIESVDSLRKHILENLNQYECLEFTTDGILNEDAHRYDTARFYRNTEGNLVYINWLRRGHYYHIMGDVINYSELVLMNNQVVFYRNWGYSFVNPQWHLEDYPNETKVQVAESIRRYYSTDGTALMDYEGREAEGTYKDRFTLLNNIPLEEVRRLIWTDRCDKCIEEDYLSVYRKLLAEKGEE